MIKGDILEVTIADIGMNGEGIAKDNGFVIFIPYALKDEQVRIEVLKVKKNFAYAKIIKLMTASPVRQDSRCKYFGKCGGCDYQHVVYEKQLEYKRQEIINCFKKNAGVDVDPKPTVPSDRIFGYRNKVQMPIGSMNGKIYAGFFREGSHYIVDVDKCILEEDGFNGYIRSFLKWANKYKLTAYNELTGKGILRHILLRHVGETTQIVIVVNANELPRLAELISAFKAYNANFTLHVNINRERSNVILGKRMLLKYGTNAIKCEMQGIKAEISPYSFMQINNSIRESIYSKVSDMLSENDDNIVIDAYSGVGILTNILAKRAKKAYGIEIVKDAVKNADELTKANGNENKVTNILGDAAVCLPKLIGELRSDKETMDSNISVVLDPPRKGADIDVMNAVLSANPDKIIYISCNPSTLARDYSYIKDNYEIKEIIPYDMFPNTRHVETVVSMSSKNKL